MFFIVSISQSLYNKRMDTPKNKLKLLEIRELLLRETDDLHTLSTQQIIDYLASKGMESERKSIYHYIELLEEFGMDIIKQKDVQNQYHLANRNFQLAELKLLVDAIKFSKFITTQKSIELIEKIKTLTSVHEAKLLQRDDIVTGRLKTRNTSIYLNVDAIHDAILGKYKLRFKYFDYDINKNVKYRKHGEHYTVIPVFLCWDDEKYYCVTYHEQHDDFVVYRVDKMRDVSVLYIQHEYQNKPEDMGKFCDQLFNMYTGEAKKVTIRFDLELLNVVLDRFGLEVDLQKVDEHYFEITETVYVSPTFLSWVIQFQDKAKIISPVEVIEEIKKTLEKTLKNYE